MGRVLVIGISSEIERPAWRSAISYRTTSDTRHAQRGCLTSLVADRAGAVLVATSPMFLSHRRQLADLALKHRLPTIFAFREYAEAGGLMAYGPSYTELFQRAAGYVVKILKGARTADLPVEQPTKFELTTQTAKALGVMLPPSVLARAD